jgi:peptidyl-tRNA hydrolase, PTH1 family
VVGLGNPGPNYARTRHNAGFWFVDALAARMGAALRPAARFFGDTADGVYEGRRVRLLKPTVFMNRSGQSVAALARYYDIPADEILIVHDEIDLPPGTVRLKLGGGHGGHNGLRDIIAALGDRDFVRLRIGVGHPGHKDDVVDAVLSRPSAREENLILEGMDKAFDALPQVLAGKSQRAMNLLNRKPPKAQSEPGTDAGKTQDPAQQKQSGEA